MTYRQDFTVPAELMEQVIEQGLDILPELIRIVLNAAMQTQRTSPHSGSRRNVRARCLHSQGESHQRAVVWCEHLIVGLYKNRVVKPAEIVDAMTTN